MKFKVIDAADVNILREARKILKRLQKRIDKLDEKREAAYGDKTKDYDALTKEEYRLFDELAVLYVCAEVDGALTLEA